ncbi:MAG: OmpH family outer membrane protein [Deltaproteobacteria bacterium]|nr:OmpH family outer membrane protein [Deltaproteobacteria bacterium]
MKRLTLLLICFLALIAANLFPAFAAEVKIGVIDTQKILSQSAKITKARADFTKEFEAKRQELIKRQSAAQALDNELATKGSTMTEQVRRDKAETLRKEARDLPRMKEEIEAEMQAKDTELGRKFLTAIRDAAQEYLNKEKLSIIVEKSSIVASDKAIDVTDQIIKLYDSKP